MSIKHKVTETRFRTLRDADPGFIIIDGAMIAYRAGFEISSRCPIEYKKVIQECINHGWLKPVATVYDHELTWNALRS